MDNALGQAISAQELHHFQNLARQYSNRSLEPLFEGDYPDGNLALLPEKLEIAFNTGIAASPHPSLPGSSYGIWGSATDEHGMIPSLLLLSTIAETCGGVAMCLHAQGVASNLILRKKSKTRDTPVRVALCLQEGIVPPYLGTIIAPDKDAPARIATTVKAEGTNYTINGIKSFVYSMDRVEAYVVFARDDDTWGCFLVPANDRRIEKIDVGARTGLRSCRLEHIEFKNVQVPLEARIDEGNGGELVIRALGLSWAGMSAIAVGIAKGAAAAARKYAAERYQGGSQIEQHAAVKILLGGSDAAIEAAEATVFSNNECNFTAVGSLIKPAAAKLTATELCARAVTDCMQAFGGYGYMEDYRMEKRLRDIAVLKSAFGSPTYIRQFVFDAKREANR